MHNVDDFDHWHTGNAGLQGSGAVTVLQGSSVLSGAGAVLQGEAIHFSEARREVLLLSEGEALHEARCEALHEGVTLSGTQRQGSSNQQGSSALSEFATTEAAEQHTVSASLLVDNEGTYDADLGTSHTELG